MEIHEPTRKTRAIMFSDIQGYSRIMGKDESRALRLLEEHNALCKPLISQGGGTILKFIGDAILSSFESASDAVHCGIEVQRALARRNSERPECDHIVVRIGIHIGDVVIKDGDVFGDGVNIAARIEPLAEPGGVAIILVPQDQKAYGTLDEVLGHYRRYSEAQLRARMEEAGFRVERMLHFNRVTRPGWRINGQVLRRRSFSRFQLRVFDALVPVWRRIDRWFPWAAVSVIAIGRVPESKSGK